MAGTHAAAGMVAPLTSPTSPGEPLSRAQLEARFGAAGAADIVEAWEADGEWALRFEDGHRETGPAPGYSDPYVGRRVVELLMALPLPPATDGAETNSAPGAPTPGADVQPAGR